MTAAKPKVADYPFTTLVPNLGVMSLKDVHNTIVVADIPGLVKNASLGAGMGIQFLRHIQRTKLLLHFVDISADIQTGKIDFERYAQKGVDKLLAHVEILEKSFILLINNLWISRGGLFLTRLIFYLHRQKRTLINCKYSNSSSFF